MQHPSIFFFFPVSCSAVWYRQLLPEYRCIFLFAAVFSSLTDMFYFMKDYQRWTTVLRIVRKELAGYAWIVYFYCNSSSRQDVIVLYLRGSCSFIDDDDNKDKILYRCFLMRIHGLSCMSAIHLHTRQLNQFLSSDRMRRNLHDSSICKPYSCSGPAIQARNKAKVDINIMNNLQPSPHPDLVVSAIRCRLAEQIIKIVNP